MPKKKKSHEENLKTVCCVCGRKGNKFKNVTHDLAEKVVKHFHPSYDRHGGIHPTAICSTCRNACIKMEEEPEQSHHRVPSLLNFSAIPELPPEAAQTAAAVSVPLEVSV